MKKEKAGKVHNRKRSFRKEKAGKDPLSKKKAGKVAPMYSYCHNVLITINYYSPLISSKYRALRIKR